MAGGGGGGGGWAGAVTRRGGGLASGRTWGRRRSLRVPLRADARLGSTAAGAAWRACPSGRRSQRAGSRRRRTPPAPRPATPPGCPPGTPCSTAGRCGATVPHAQGQGRPRAGFRQAAASRRACRGVLSMPRAVVPTPAGAQQRASARRCAAAHSRPGGGGSGGGSGARQAGRRKAGARQASKQTSAPVGPQLHLLHHVIKRDEVAHIDGHRVLELFCRGVCTQ